MTANVDDIFSIGALIMKPFSTATLKQKVSSVTQADGIAKVTWSRAHGTTARARDEVITLPDDLIVDGQSVIMAEATYDYDSPIDYMMPNLTTFSQVYYLRPRTVDQVICTDC